MIGLLNHLLSLIFSVRFHDHSEKVSGSLPRGIKWYWKGLQTDSNKFVWCWNPCLVKHEEILNPYCKIAWYNLIFWNTPDMAIPSLCPILKICKFQCQSTKNSRHMCKWFPLNPPTSSALASPSKCGDWWLDSIVTKKYLTSNQKLQSHHIYLANGHPRRFSWCFTMVHLDNPRFQEFHEVSASRKKRSC